MQKSKKQIVLLLVAFEMVFEKKITFLEEMKRSKAKERKKSF